jgi:hypothetical protein
MWYYCPRLRYDLPATCFRLFLLLRRKRFLSTLLDPRLPCPDSYMLRLLFDLLLSPTQFSSLPAVRMLAYNLFNHSSLRLCIKAACLIKKRGVAHTEPLLTEAIGLTLWALALRQRHEVPGSSKPRIKAQTIASHTASQQQAPYCPHWRYECRQHVEKGVTIMSLMSIDCLYVQRRLLSVWLRRRRKKLCKSALYTYTEEMRYLDRFVQ